MDEWNDKDALWKLLGNARTVEASPYFTRKVLRAVQQPARPPFSLSLVLRWLLPASAAAALVIGWAGYSWQTDQRTAEFNEFFDSAADLQSLVVQDDTSIWLGS